MLRITAARVVVTSLGRNSVTQKIETDAVFPHAHTLERGLMHPGGRPGLGIDLDEALAARYSYKRAFLPVKRLEDGTLFNW